MEIISGERVVHKSNLWWTSQICPFGEKHQEDDCLFPEGIPGPLVTPLSPLRLGRLFYIVPYAKEVCSLSPVFHGVYKEVTSPAPVLSSRHLGVK